MEILRCLECGGQIRLNDNEFTGVCRNCKNVFIISDSVKKNISDYALGCEYLNKCEFDHAKEKFDKIISKGKFFEAGFASKLCQYSIDIINENGNMFPIFYKINSSMLSEDTGFQNLILEKGYEKTKYQALAKKIDYITNALNNYQLPENDCCDIFVCACGNSDNLQKGYELQKKFTLENKKVFFPELSNIGKSDERSEVDTYFALKYCKLFILMLNSKPDNITKRRYINRFLKINGKKNIIVISDCDEYIPDNVFGAFCLKPYGNYIDEINKKINEENYFGETLTATEICKLKSLLNGHGDTFSAKRNMWEKTILPENNILPTEKHIKDTAYNTDNTINIASQQNKPKNKQKVAEEKNKNNVQIKSKIPDNQNNSVVTIKQEKIEKINKKNIREKVEENTVSCYTDLAVNYFEVKNHCLKRYYGNETTVIIPADITIIDKKAFAGNTIVKKIIMGDCVTEIHPFAFKDMTNLENVTFGKNVRKIGASAFENCIKLQSVTLDRNITFIEKFAFKNCKKLKSVTLLSDFTVIDNYPFWGTDPSFELRLPYNFTFNRCSKYYDVRNNGFVDIEKITIIQ